MGKFSYLEITWVIHVGFKIAIRELVLNALIHRDYLSPVDIQIKIFDNQISFFNPGRLFGDLTIEDLKKDNYQAYARNKLIAEAFYLTGDIEKYGSGFLRIRKEIQVYPSMQMTFKEIPNGFLIVLKYVTQKMYSYFRTVNLLSGGLKRQMQSELFQN